MRKRSSIAELSFHGIAACRVQQPAKSVTHVSGTKRPSVFQAGRLCVFDVKP